MNNLVLKISRFVHINGEFSSVRQLEHVILKCPPISVLPLQKLVLFSLNINKNNLILLYTDSRMHQIKSNSAIRITTRRRLNGDC